MDNKVLALVAVVVLLLAAGVVAAQTRGGDTTGPDVPVGGGDGDDTLTPDGDEDRPDPSNVSRDRDHGDNTSWYERIKNDDTRSPITNLSVDSKGSFDPSSHPAAGDFGREIRTTSMAGDVTPSKGVGPDVRSVDGDPVHVVVQFDADDPTVSGGGTGIVPGFVPFLGSSGPGDVEAEYSLTPCGSYMDAAGWKNAHCYGVPADELDGFLDDGAVHAVVHRDADWKLEDGLRDRLVGDGHRLLVELYPDANLTADDLNASFGTTFVPNHDGTVLRTAPVTTNGTARSIAENESVAWVQWQRPMTRTLDQSRELVGANEMNGQTGDGGLGVTGDDALIGIHDSGIDDGHRHFTDPAVDVTYSADWVDWGMPPEDEAGHGTHVAGTITGNGSGASGTIYTGIAPEADLVVARGLGPNGYAGVAGRLMPAGRFARMQNDAPRTMDAISNSWSGGSSSRASPVSRYDLNARSADRYALFNRDTLLLFANGNACASFDDSDRDPFNNGTSCAMYVRQPALGKNVLSVGATRMDGGVSSLNNMLPPEDVRDLDNGRVKPEVLAPGERITAPNDTRQYVSKPGTSMSTPHVAGVVALLEEHHRDVGIDVGANAMRALLVATTSPVRNPNDWLAGYGEVNAHDAAFDNNYESSSFFYSGEMVEGGETVRTFDVPEDAHQIDATLAWMDPDLVAGGTTGFIFNWLDLELEGPDGSRQNLDPTNLKKVTVEDPAPGEWRLIVTGVNVGRWNQKRARQPYDGVLRVIEDEPAVEVALQTDEMRTAYRPRNLDDNDIRVGVGDNETVELKAIGTGSVVSDVEILVDTTQTQDVELCSGAGQRTVDAGDLSRGQEENWTVCLNATASAPVGDTFFGVLVDSTNGVNSTPNRNVIQAPFFVAETQQPKNVTNVHSTTHAINTYSNETEFRFEWDRTSDRGGSGLDGYYRDLAIVPPSATDEYGYTVETASESWPRYIDDPDSTGVNITVASDGSELCFDPDGSEENCAPRPDRGSDHTYWFYIKAQDKSKVLGDRTALGPYRIDTKPPESFALKIGDSSPTANNGNPEFAARSHRGNFYEINSTSTEVLWEEPLDRIAEYEYTVTKSGRTLDSGRVTREEAYIAPVSRWSVDSALSITGLQSGINQVQVTARDRAGNTRTETVNVCVSDDGCDTSVQPGQIGEDVRDPDAVQHAGIDDPDAILDGSAFERRLREQLDCPGTRLCGDDRPGWAGMVDDEDLLVTVEGPDGEVQGRYFAEMEDGRVANVERVTDPAEVDQSVDVTTDAGTVREIMDADDTMGAIGTAYDEGAIELRGNGLRNRLKYGAIETGYGAYSAASGAVEAAREISP